MIGPRQEAGEAVLDVIAPVSVARRMILDQRRTSRRSAVTDVPAPGTHCFMSWSVSRLNPRNSALSTQNNAVVIMISTRALVSMPTAVTTLNVNGSTTRGLDGLAEYRAYRNPSALKYLSESRQCSSTSGSPMLASHAATMSKPTTPTKATRSAILAKKNCAESSNQ